MLFSDTRGRGELLEKFADLHHCCHPLKGFFTCRRHRMFHTRAEWSDYCLWGFSGWIDSNIPHYCITLSRKCNLKVLSPWARSSNSSKKMPSFKVILCWKTGVHWFSFQCATECFLLLHLRILKLDSYCCLLLSSGHMLRHLRQVWIVSLFSFTVVAPYWPTSDHRVTKELLICGRLIGYWFL